MWALSCFALGRHTLASNYRAVVVWPRQGGAKILQLLGPSGLGWVGVRVLGATMAVGFKLLCAWPVTVMWLLVPSGGSLVEGFRGVVAARGLGLRGDV